MIDPPSPLDSLTPEERWERYDGPVNSWFSLSYCSYFCLPRMAMQEMPLDWQERFVALMQEAEDLGATTPAKYNVLRRGERGRIIEDPWRNYRRGSPVDARAADREMEKSRG